MMSNAQVQDPIQRAIKDGEVFISATRSKMEKLVEEFADGRLNREQFHTLYDRYQTQINGVQTMIRDTDPDGWQQMIDGERTIAIRKRLMGKAKGMLIYNDKTGILLDTMGDFSVDPLLISELLKKLGEEEKEKARSEDASDNCMAVETKDNSWVFLARGKFTTIVTAFTREPTSDQQETLMQLHKDFERANASLLEKSGVTVNELAMPFRVLIKQAGKK